MSKLFLSLILMIAALQLSYADESNSSPEDSATAIIEPTIDPLITKLIALSGCNPTLKSTCTYTTADPLVFLEYLKKCNLLNKWNITYLATPDQQVSMTASPTQFCTIVLANAKKTKKTICPITETDVKNMTSPEAIEFLKNFKETPENTTIPVTVMETLFKPIDDCIKKDIPEALQPFTHPDMTPITLPPDFFNSKQPTENMQ